MGDPATAGNDTTPAADLALHTARALRGLSAIVDRLEEQLLTEVAQLRGDPATLTTLQSVDLLSQSLAELDGLMRRFAEYLPPDVAVESTALFAPMKLAELQACVMGAVEPEVESNANEKGNVALF
ncbi:MAG: hypothetical protein AAFU41_09010 [Pseudomonadota bacterium]